MVVNMTVISVLSGVSRPVPYGVAFSEITHLPEVNVIKIPDNVSFEEAAAASMTLLTSWHMLVGRAKIKPGQTVLIMGGGSGVGSFGIQIAKLYNCTVIATASPDKLDKCHRTWRRLCRGSQEG